MLFLTYLLVYTFITGWLSLASQQYQQPVTMVHTEGVGLLMQTCLASDYRSRKQNPRSSIENSRMKNFRQGVNSPGNVCNYFVGDMPKRNSNLIDSFDERETVEVTTLQEQFGVNNGNIRQHHDYDEDEEDLTEENLNGNELFTTVPTKTSSNGELVKILEKALELRKKLEEVQKHQDSLRRINESADKTIRRVLKIRRLTQNKQSLLGKANRYYIRKLRLLLREMKAKKKYTS